MALSRTCLFAGLMGLALSPTLAGAGDLDASERGRLALLGRAFTPMTWSTSAYRNAWKSWGLKEAPADFPAAFRERYGLHPAPYSNSDLPMGLREVPGLLYGKGLTTDCMLCHGGSIFGKSYVGLGNSALDIQAFFEELSGLEGRPARTPFVFGRVRGTSEAGAMAVYLLGWRQPDLRINPRWQDFGLRDDLVEDTPAWWLLKKKQTMYYTGGADARSVRSIMQFMMSPLNPPSVWHKEEQTFRDIQAFLRTIEPPKYPLPVDTSLALQGKALFEDNCARCHGTYGEKPSYPNKVVEIAQIGTDRRRFDGISPQFGEFYNRSWFAKEREGWLFDEFTAKETAGYQAPPLDGVWVTAPYLHNGSIPTVYHVLNSKARPRVFTRSYRTDEADYDPTRLGWKHQEVEPADAKLPARERRKIYDTTQPGRGNGGHTFGDHLTDAERFAVIEYLKTL